MKDLTNINIREEYKKGNLSIEEIHFVCTDICKMGIPKDDKIECTHIMCPYGFWADPADLD